VATDWVRVAVECGYADQSHLIHDYAAFAGQTPVSLLAAESELSTYFTAPQRLAALFGAPIGKIGRSRSRMDCKNATIGV